jgi:hypothetical protein
VTGELSTGPIKLLVEHPVTSADTQQSSVATVALAEVIPKHRFIIGYS